MLIAAGRAPCSNEWEAMRLIAAMSGRLDQDLAWGAEGVATGCDLWMRQVWFLTRRVVGPGRVVMLSYQIRHTSRQIAQQPRSNESAVGTPEGTRQGTYSS